MQFKTLRSRIIVTFLTLILFIQLLGFAAIRLSIDKNANASINQSLNVGERIFINLLDHSGENLTQASTILAQDYGFRQAVTSADENTIRSAVVNQQERINANIAYFYPTATSPSTIIGSTESAEALEIAQKLINQIQNNQPTSNFYFINHKPYQLVAAPVKAPITVGWVVMGFEINDKLALKLNRLTNLEVSFISRPKSPTGWTTVASTLSKSAQESLINQSPDNIDGSKLKNLIYQFNDDDYITRFVNISDVQDEVLVAVLQSSLSEASAPFINLQLNLLILSIMGACVFVIGSFFTAKKISEPISQLEKLASQIESGNYAINFHSERPDEIGNLSRSFATMADAISSREKSISKLAYWDEMTDLPNRLSFIKELEILIHANTSRQNPFSVIVIDINRFKQINNVLGTKGGDELLKYVGERIANSIKSLGDMVARLGGDEFAILLKSCDEKLAMEVANRLEQCLALPFKIEDQSIDLTASFGVSIYPNDGESASLLMSRAEMAMYVAKHSGSNIELFKQSFDRDSQLNLTLLSDLKKAIEQDELCFFVQPKVDLNSNQVFGVEALIRWWHPERGMIFPDQFIPFAEQTGFISKISFWMIHKMIKIQQEWLALGIKVPIAINLSTRDLINSELPNTILEILESNQIDRNLISLEITESSMMQDPKKALSTLKKLSDLGIKLSVDDFGTGYSSLAYLKDLPVDEIKIDKSFVLNMDSQINDAKIVRSTIDLAHNLGFKVVAEGIENENVWSTLKESGCDFGQGYYLSKPMNYKDFHAWLSTWDNTSKT